MQPTGCALGGHPKWSTVPLTQLVAIEQLQVNASCRVCATDSLAEQTFFPPQPSWSHRGAIQLLPTVCQHVGTSCCVVSRGIKRGESQGADESTGCVGGGEIQVVHCINRCVAQPEEAVLRRNEKHRFAG